MAGVGCNFCGHTGYYDRLGIYEVLPVTDEMKELIVTDAPHAELRDARDRAGHDDAARPGHPAGHREQDHHRRGAPHRLRALAAEEPARMPTYRYVAVGPDGSEVKDGSTRRARTRCATSC